MNYIKYNKQIKTLLHTNGGKPYSGNYIYSRDIDDYTYKIGMSQAGLYNRVQTAKSCYPYKSEFWIHYIIISLDGQFSKATKSTTRHIEDDLLTTSKTMSTVSLQKSEIEEGRRPTEYRFVATKVKLYTNKKYTQ